MRSRARARYAFNGHSPLAADSRITGHVSRFRATKIIRAVTPLVVALATSIAALLALPRTACAQDVVAPVESLDFNRPESWALKYFTSNTLLGGLEMPDGRRPGSIDLGLEIDWIPRLTTSQQLIGFDGTKQEDLNKAPIFARPRLTLAFPGQVSVTVAGVPPVKTFGITPRLFAIAVGRPFSTAHAWQLGARVSAQAGTATSAFTCPPSVLAFPPGDPQNAYGCQAPSSDTATLRFVSGEIDAWRPAPKTHGFAPHFSVALNYMDGVFQVDARTFDLIDHTQLRTHGMTASVSGGIACTLTHRIGAAVDVFYSPLSVQRPPATTSTIEGLLSARALVTYRLR